MDVWIGGGMSKNDTHFTVEGNADIYFGVPSVQTVSVLFSFLFYLDFNFVTMLLCYFTF
jgi:hypothetical protein